MRHSSRGLLIVLSAVVLLASVELGWSQERGGRSGVPKIIEGVIYEIGRRTLQLDTGQRSRGRVSPVIVPVEPGTTKFLSVGEGKVTMKSLEKGDVVVVKYRESDYDPVAYVIDTGEKREVKSKRRSR
jgi:hypothetical protein